MIDYKKLLNPEQYEVVTEADGPCLVLAGAGSGKTRTLVFRVAYLIEQGVKPENILLVTFTNKAAKEMLSRVEEYLGFEPEHLWGGTFHHIGNLMLRKHATKLGYHSNFNILDQDDSVTMIKHSMDELGLNVKGQNFPKAKLIQAVISYSRNTNYELKDVAENNYGFPDFIADKVVEIAFKYGEKKKKANVMDFDDLLVNWLKLLEQSPDVKEKYSKQFQYILVDEYQDTNFIQASVIKNLASYHNNVLVVGDDSQSIYSFRAADVKNILDFPKLFPKSKVFKIETNYRSTPQILDLANESISRNIDQFPKKLKAERESSILPSLIAARDERNQATLITKRIMQIYREGQGYKDIAILYRSTYQSAEIQLELSKQNIPYVVRGGMRYFEQAHIKDVISYLKIMANPQDEIALKRILLMYEGIGQKRADKIWQQIQKFTSLADIINFEMKITGKAGIGWTRVVETFKHLDSLDKQQKGFIAEAIEYVMQYGYEDYLKNNYENYRDRLDDISQLTNFVAMYDNLETLLSDVILSEKFAGAHEYDKKAVILSTIHQAKGLEWSVVFVIGLRDGHFPHHKCVDNPKELEEERRLFYVAVTRAKDELNMVYPIRSFSFKFGEVFSKPSMFILELDESKYMKEGHKPFEDEYEENVIYYD
jgi:DNA helicase II / ATP-dependent DNA helicase PcrA